MTFMMLFRIGLAAVAADQDPRLESRRELDEPGGGPGVQPELVDDRHRPAVFGAHWTRGPADSRRGPRRSRAGAPTARARRFDERRGVRAAGHRDPRQVPGPGPRRRPVRPAVTTVRCASQEAVHGAASSRFSSASALVAVTTSTDSRTPVEPVREPLRSRSAVDVRLDHQGAAPGQLPSQRRPRPPSPLTIATSRPRTRRVRSCAHASNPSLSSRPDGDTDAFHPARAQRGRGGPADREHHRRHSIAGGGRRQTEEAVDGIDAGEHRDRHVGQPVAKPMDRARVPRPERWRSRARNVRRRPRQRTRPPAAPPPVRVASPAPARPAGVRLARSRAASAWPAADRPRTHPDPLHRPRTSRASGPRTSRLHPSRSRASRSRASRPRASCPRASRSRASRSRASRSRASRSRASRPRASCHCPAAAQIPERISPAPCPSTASRRLRAQPFRLLRIASDPPPAAPSRRRGSRPRPRRFNAAPSRVA